MLQKKWFPVVILCIFCIPLFFLNIQHTFSFGDDWTQYVKEAQNIASGKPYYASGFIFNSANTDYAPPQYPPGYPMLIAPVVGFFGIAPQPLFYMNALFISVLLFAAYYYYRHYSEKISAMCLAIILCYTSFIIDMKKHALSDIPCALFVTLYLAFRGSKNLSGKRLLLLILLGVFATLIRSQTILLVAAEGIVFGYEFLRDWIKNKKSPGFAALKRPSFLLCVGMAVLFIFFNTVVFHAPNGTLQFYKQIYVTHISNLWELIGRNVNNLLDMLSSVLSHDPYDPFFKFPITIITMSSIAFGLIGLILSLKKGLRTDNVFFLLMCGMIIITPVYQGLRYLLPAVPIFLLFVKDGLKMVLPQLVKVSPWKIAVGCTLIFLGLGYDDYERASHLKPEWAPETADSVAFSYVKTHVSDSDIVVFVKPRLLTLYTGKKAMNLAWQENEQRNREILDSFKATYMLTRRYLTDDLFWNYLKQPGVYVDSLHINELYDLYRLRR
ncbi:glycosyltransferase family 39 protein [Taibaiella soli]|uniref:Glycosyltransferase RgtA/B/C/D-like domain-containing protein n=1 Tax=Taibaiella soli TaxID=1649169 RepID=A0A2W2BD59_9BACT|nr:glycosyltransferase family 39 protein [Taibaiella soli]PZF73797.1 hypothetical protein DN068_05500 [Taibaiella soli]